jgi:hypothetical protein
MSNFFGPTKNNTVVFSIGQTENIEQMALVGMFCLELCFGSILKEASNHEFVIKNFDLSATNWIHGGKSHFLDNLECFLVIIIIWGI